MYLGVDGTLNKRQHAAPLVLESPIQANEPKMSTDLFVNSLNLAIGLWPAISIRTGAFFFFGKQFH